MNRSSCPQLSDAEEVVEETSSGKRCNFNLDITGKSEKNSITSSQATHLDAGSSLETNCTTLIGKLIKEPSRNGVGNFEWEQHQYKILETNNLIGGLIYIIINSITNKYYIGQTRTHRLNKKKFRPSGVIKRYKDHINEALHKKKTACSYLNQSIRKYGEDKFSVHLIHLCNVDELDQWEQYYIKHTNSIYPNGYNLTLGGKTAKAVKLDIINPNFTVDKEGSWRRKKRSEETKLKMSKSLQNIPRTEEWSKKHSMSNQKGLYNSKIERLKDVIFDLNKIDQYIVIRYKLNTNIANNVVVRDIKKPLRNNIQVVFSNKFLSIQELYNQAIDFINDIVRIQKSNNQLVLDNQQMSS